MGLPDIVIEFTKKAVASFSVGTGGIVGIIIKDGAKATGAKVLKSIEDIPESWTDKNKAYVTRAFTGTPNKVIVYGLASTAADYNEAFKYFGTTRVNYLCGDPDISAELAGALATWVKGKRKAGKVRPLAVVPGVAADDKGVVSLKFVGGTKIKEGEKEYTAGEYCSRIAGLLAGLDLNVSATYKPLSEITEIPIADDEEVDTTVDDGYLVPFDTGSGIVIARGVTNLKTVTQVDTEDLKKIKIVAIQDLITQDIMDTINKSYIGNYSNSYDNKCLLITAIQGYFAQLESPERGYLQAGHSTCEINVDKQRAYLESTGVDTSEMDEQAIKEANTGSKVFLKASVSILDAIEDVEIIINKE